MYGNRFTREYGDSAPETWARTIKSLRDYELTRGLRRLLSFGSGSPPTLPQFVKACRAVDPDDVVRPGNTAKLPPPNIDHYDAFGSRMLFTFLLGKQGTSEAALHRMIARKNKIIAEVREFERNNPDEPFESADIQRTLHSAFERELEPTVDAGAEVKP